MHSFLFNIIFKYLFTIRKIRELIFNKEIITLSKHFIEKNDLDVSILNVEHDTNFVSKNGENSELSDTKKIYETIKRNDHNITSERLMHSLKAIISLNELFEELRVSEKSVITPDKKVVEALLNPGYKLGIQQDLNGLVYPYFNEVSFHYSLKFINQ